MLAQDLAQGRMQQMSSGVITPRGLASISVDPARDTPEKLRTFAATYGAKPGRWRFSVES